MAWKRKELTEENLEWFKKHIDLHIIDLIIKMNRLPFLETAWSCGGHILSDKYRLYHSGIIFLVDKDSENGRKFIKELRKLIKKYKFAHLNPFFDLPACSEYHLDVDKFEYPKLKDKDGEEAGAYLKNAFNETYGKLNVDLEAFIDKWLQKLK